MMADDLNEDGNTASDSEQENQDASNNDRAIVTHQGVTKQHREYTSGVKDPKGNSSEGHRSDKEGQPHATDFMGLFHGHQGRLEQLEQELERQREAERNLRSEIEGQKEVEEKLSRLESTFRGRNSRSDRDDSLLGGEDPFNEDILRVKVPRNFKSPDMDLYDGTTDPKHHLSNFEAVIMGLVNGLREGPFSHSISKRHPTSLSDVQERAEKYINMEENARLREPTWRPGHSHSSKEKESPRKKRMSALKDPGDTTSILLYKFPSSMSTEKFVTLKGYLPLGPSRIKRGEVVANIVSTINYMVTQQVIVTI
ncbi:uncharacterized protein [Arachis hypogaea]|uniref:uncharacterized protein n=1 Tax=Arachis hypogaea TaxID=3818 RepID=UPI003B225FE2